MIYSIFFSILILFSNTIANGKNPPSENEGDVIIKVTNIENMKGELLVGIYDSKKTFRKVKKVMKYAVKAVEDGTEVVVLEDIPAGIYAVALFQDFNGNRKFDKNFMGVPKEPFGFSTNYIVKRRAPMFKEVTFQHNGTSTELEIQVQEW